ncbi:MFS transporter [Actinomadura sp. HBU206391]|uniref:MFS transporter n=1 Tax=Actinomadura sp. HBU206391 TaxID=2731692 RepID=UPI0016502767|nr:MFS transporter [Actinomadura sp. HBU206391]MBC6460300.1 MFS transporter [Actinomadura sp. HBU206391]
MRSAGRSVRGAGRSVRGATRRIARTTRRVTHAQGAGRSGLGSLIEAHAVNSAGDALVAVALAGTIFFGLDVNQARGQVALYLVVTMAPFVLIAPLIGPALDRMRSARRVAMAGTMLARGLLCWGMAGAVSHGDAVTFLPAAFGVLVLSKAFGVLRSAVTPRVLPDQITLVTANARASFAGLIAASITAPVGAGLGVLIGQDWLLRIAMLVFILGAVFCVRLPKHVDTPETATEPDRPGERARWRSLLRVGPAVGDAMLANAALRAFSGFLILYLAFLLREQRFDPVSPNVALGLLVACAGAGGMVGTVLGARAKARAPQLIVFGTLAFATTMAAVGAVFFGLWAALAVAFVGAFGQSLGKLSLDAVVQREIGEEVRSSTFAVSETLHQLVWVLGGLIGLGMSTRFDGRVALSSVAAALGLSLVLLLTQRVRRRARRTPARMPRPAGGEAAEATAKSP